MDWKKLLGSITVSVDQELRLRNEYLAAENRLLRQQINGRVPLTDSDRKALAGIGQQLGKKVLTELATIAKPDTILAWHHKLVGQKDEGSQPRKSVGRPAIDQEIEALVVRMARENRSWGYDRIVGALANLGHSISDQTVGNILKRHGLPAGSRAEEDHHLERIYPHAYGGPRRYGLLHRRGLDDGRPDDVLRALFYPSEQPEGPCCGCDAASQSSLDDADRAQYHHGGVGR